MVEGALVGGGVQGHWEVVFQRTLFQQRLHGGENPHFREYPHLVMGEEKQVRGGVGVVAHQLQRIRQAGFLLKDNLQLRHGLGKMRFQRGNDRVLFIVPDHQFARFGGIGGLPAAGGERQQHTGAQKDWDNPFHRASSF